MRHESQSCAGDKTLSLMELMCEGQRPLNALMCPKWAACCQLCQWGRWGGGDKRTHSLNRINQRTVNTHTSHRPLKHIWTNILNQNRRVFKRTNIQQKCCGHVRCLLDPGHWYGEKVKSQKSFLQRTEAGEEASRNRLRQTPGTRLKEHFSQNSLFSHRTAPKNTDSDLLISQLSQRFGMTMCCFNPGNLLLLSYGVICVTFQKKNMTFSC